MNRKKTLGALERALSWAGGGYVMLGESPSSGLIFPSIYGCPIAEHPICWDVLGPYLGRTLYCVYFSQ